MAATQSKLGFGTLLKYGDGASPEVFTKVAEITGDIEGPGLSRDMQQATHMESPDAYHEYIAGLKDGETVEFEANFISENTSQEGLLAIFESGVRRNWQVELTQYSPSAVLEFAGVVQNFNYAFPLEGPMQISVSIKVTGKPGFAGA